MRVPPPLSALPRFLAGPGRRPAWRRRVLRKALSAALAAAAVLVLLALLRPPEPAPRIDVPVASRDLPAGTVLAAGDVETVTVPAALAGTAGSARGVPDVVGRILAGGVEKGEPLRASRVLSPQTGRGLAPGEVVVAVPLTSRAVAATVRVGSRVDLVVGGRAVAGDAPVLAVTRAPDDASMPAMAGRQDGAELLVAVPRAAATAVVGTESDPTSPSVPVVLLRPDPPPVAAQS